MTYDPNSFSTGTKSSVFNAHSDQSQVVSVGQAFSFEISEGISIVDGGVSALYKKAYCVGETRTDGVTDEYNLCDIKIDNNEGSSAEGYQVRNNANGTVLMDDACYGTVGTMPISMKLAASNFGSEGNSEAFETRLIGVFTK